MGRVGLRNWESLSGTTTTTTIRAISLSHSPFLGRSSNPCHKATYRHGPFQDVEHKYPSVAGIARRSNGELAVHRLERPSSGPQSAAAEPFFTRPTSTSWRMTECRLPDHIPRNAPTGRPLSLALPARTGQLCRVARQRPRSFAMPTHTASRIWPG